MYNCEACGHTSDERQPMLRHIIYRKVPYTATVKGVGSVARTRQEVKREIPVCGVCHSILQEGIRFEELVRTIDRQRRREAASIQKVTERKSVPDGVPVKLSVHVKPVDVDKMLDGAHRKPFKPDRPKCDLCGADATGGQVTQSTTLCPEHRDNLKLQPERLKKS